MAGQPGRVLIAGAGPVGMALAYDPTAIDAAARRVRDERWPEIVAVQEMQQHQARILFAPDHWRTRMVNRLLPWLVRTGMLSWMQRKEFQLLSDGAVAVRLMV